MPHQIDLSERKNPTMGTSDTDDSLSSASKDEVTSKYFAVVPEESKIGHKTPGVIVKTKPQGLQLRKLDPDIERFILDLSSDSSLSDVPSDLDDQEFCLNISASSGLYAPQREKKDGSRNRKRKPMPRISPYFQSMPSPSQSPAAESCLPFPPISAPTFGLVQEQLAHDPFRMLIATIFLNRTRGGVAIPVLFNFFDRYPTIEAVANASIKDVVDSIRCLGFQNQRARKCVELARTWLEKPPTKGRRYRKINYPRKGDGHDVGAEEVIGDDADDPRVAWEIAHLRGVGTYALDSWRIFCRDELRGLAKDWMGTGAEGNGDFEPEWKRVLPTDKELRAYLTWMWLKEGWIWDPETGQRTRASEEMMRAARKGGYAREGRNGNWVLLELEGEDLGEGEPRKMGLSLGYSASSTLDVSGKVADQ